MEKRHLDRRLDADARPRAPSSGTSVNVGVDVTVDELRASYDAVVLAGGATACARPADPRPRARRHPPGDGVPAAVQPGAGGRPRRVADHAPTGKHVVIIGGGDTGADCLGTAHRQGAASVHQFEILPRPPDDRAPSRRRGRRGR